MYFSVLFILFSSFLTKNINKYLELGYNIGLRILKPHKYHIRLMKNKLKDLKFSVAYLTNTGTVTLSSGVRYVNIFIISND